MLRRPPGFTRSEKPCPSTTLFRSELGCAIGPDDLDSVTLFKLGLQFRRHGCTAAVEIPDACNVLGRNLGVQHHARHGRRAARNAGLALAYRRHPFVRSEEHTSELQSLMRISYAVFCLKKKIS